MSIHAPTAEVLTLPRAVSTVYIEFEDACDKSIWYMNSFNRAVDVFTIFCQTYIFPLYSISLVRLQVDLNS